MCGVATANGIGPRESSVSRCRRAQLLPGFRIAPAACPLARSPVLQYVHSIRLCLDVNRVGRTVFETAQAPPPDAGAGVSRDGFGTETGMDRLPYLLGHDPCKRLRARDRRRVPGGRMSRPIEHTQLRNAGIL